MADLASSGCIVTWVMLRTGRQFVQREPWLPNEALAAGNAGGGLLASRLLIANLYHGNRRAGKCVRKSRSPISFLSRRQIVKKRRVICRSGLQGEQSLLQSRYADFCEFEAYASMWSIHTRLGYKRIRRCWDANPLIQSSTNPSDLCCVRTIKEGDKTRFVRKFA